MTTEILRLLNNLTDDQLDLLDEEKFAAALFYLYHPQ